MTSRQLDEEAVFHIARKLDDLHDRSAYLQQVCAGDQALQERVEALLKVHEQEQAFLNSGSANPPPTAEAEPLAERPGATIGRYRLMEQIGEGGMGVVFVAEQEKPIRRKVALKVIKPGMESQTRQYVTYGVWVAPVATYIAGNRPEADEAQFEAIADRKESWYMRAYVQYWVGLKRPSQGDRRGAIEKFNQCITAGTFDASHYGYAAALLSRLKDPNWPGY